MRRTKLHAIIPAVSLVGTVFMGINTVATHHKAVQANAVANDFEAQGNPVAATFSHDAAHTYEFATILNEVAVGAGLVGTALGCVALAASRPGKTGTHVPTLRDPIQ